jgi:hypothetical protein
MEPLRTGITPNTTTHIENSRAVLFSSRFRQRNVLLANFANDPGTLFYSLDPGDNTIIPFLRGLSQGLRDLVPSFGTETSRALNRDGITPTALADALAADLGKVKPKAKYLILDAFDHLEMDENAALFFTHLVENLPHGPKLIINSRKLTYYPWYPLVKSGEAVVLGDETSLDGGIFNEKYGEGFHLEVYGFSKGNVFVNGEPVTAFDGP